MNSESSSLAPVWQPILHAISWLRRLCVITYGKAGLASKGMLHWWVLCAHDLTAWWTQHGYHDWYANYVYDQNLPANNVRLCAPSLFMLTCAYSNCRICTISCLVTVSRVVDCSVRSKKLTVRDSLLRSRTLWFISLSTSSDADVCVLSDFERKSPSNPPTVYAISLLSTYVWLLCTGTLELTRSES